MSSAPHCAVRVMIQAARDLRREFPMGAAAVERDFYIDDCLSGAEDDVQARQLCYEIDSLLRSCALVLDKWRSYRPNLIPGTGDHVQSEESMDLGEFADTTAMVYAGSRRLMSFQPPPIIEKKCATKLKYYCADFRSEHLHMGPVVIADKVIMKKLCRTAVDWDELVPDAISRE